MRLFSAGVSVALGVGLGLAEATALAKRAPNVDACPGYVARNVVSEGGRITADLGLAGTPCGVYGEDLKELKVEVEYQTGAFTNCSTNLCVWNEEVVLTIRQKPASTSRSTTQTRRCTKSPNPSSPARPARMSARTRPHSRSNGRRSRSRSRS